MTVERHTAVGRPHVIWVTSRVEAVDHAVLDADMAATVTSGTGVYTALCGASVPAAFLEMPPRPRCLRCQTYAWARATLRDAQLEKPRPRHRQAGMFARFWMWLRGLSSRR